MEQTIRQLQYAIMELTESNKKLANEIEHLSNQVYELGLK